MPDYSAVFLPGLLMTSQAAGPVTGGDPLEVAGSGTCQRATPGPSGLGSAKVIGIASHDAAPGRPVTYVAARPVHEGPADGPVTAGDQVMASSVAGRQVRSCPPAPGTPGKADIDAARAVIGIALTTAPDNATVRWMQT